jgi:hypothetical protein
MPETITSQPKVDFEAVASGVLDAIRPVVEREMKEAANQLYGATLEAVQDYLSDNASFNIRSRLDAAERERRTQWERAEALSSANAIVLEALAEARVTLLILKRNVETEIRSHDGLFRWEGVPEAIQTRIDQCSAIIAASKSESPND